MSWHHLSFSLASAPYPCSPTPEVPFPLSPIPLHPTLFLRPVGVKLICPAPSQPFPLPLSPSLHLASPPASLDYTILSSHLLTMPPVSNSPSRPFCAFTELIFLTPTQTLPWTHLFSTPCLALDPPQASCCVLSPMGGGGGGVGRKEPEAHLCPLRLQLRLQLCWKSLFSFPSLSSPLPPPVCCFSQLSPPVLTSPSLQHSLQLFIEPSLREKWVCFQS